MWTGCDTDCGVSLPLRAFIFYTAAQIKVCLHSWPCLRSLVSPKGTAAGFIGLLRGSIDSHWAWFQNVVAHPVHCRNSEVEAGRPLISVQWSTSADLARLLANGELRGNSAANARAQGVGNGAEGAAVCVCRSHLRRRNSEIGQTLVKSEWINSAVPVFINKYHFETPQQIKCNFCPRTWDSPQTETRAPYQVSCESISGLILCCLSEPEREPNRPFGRKGLRGNERGWQAGGWLPQAPGELPAGGRGAGGDCLLQEWRLSAQGSDRDGWGNSGIPHSMLQCNTLYPNVMSRSWSGFNNAPHIDRGLERLEL